MENETKLVPITDDQKDGGGRLLPEVREKTVEQIEKYLNVHKKYSVNEIAKELNVSWETARVYVDEVVERWRKEDIGKIQQTRKRFTDVFNYFIDQTEAKAAAGTLTISEMQETINIFKEIMAFTKLEIKPAESAVEASKVVSVHFNNLNVTPSMEAELKKTQHDGNSSSGHTGD